jgi:multidrug resistance efflux pump
MASFDGVIKARIVEVRFAVAGKIVGVRKLVGDRVTKWELIASLDRKMLQTELDSQLADFERVRAEFEIFNQKNPDPQSAIDKYLKTEKQAALNISVKDVELAKARLDQCDLFSPVEGIILDDSGIVVGINTTPAGGAIKIIDSSSYFFEFEIEQKDIPFFSESKETKVELPGIGMEVVGKTSLVIPDGKKFFVRVPIMDNRGLLLGLNGKANF